MVLFFFLRFLSHTPPTSHISFEDIKVEITREARIILLGEQNLRMRGEENEFRDKREREDMKIKTRRSNNLYFQNFTL